VTALGGIRVWPEPGSDPPARAGFRISGSARDLLPGVLDRLTVTVRNPYPFAIRVTAIRAGARDSGACKAENLRLTALRRPLVVPQRSVRRFTLPIELASDAPDACQGASFPLVFSGRAVRA
jgi:hypothetical protein